MRQTAVLIAAIALLAACGGDPTAAKSTELLSRATSPGEASLGAAVNKDLATVRRVTAPFRVFSKAQAAGWWLKLFSCITNPGGAGGTGFFYANPDLVDRTVSVDKPEVLLYEPDKNGRLRLVGVDYWVFFSARDPNDGPPVLFGQQFKRSEVLGLWELHAWVWKHNPNGMFAEWNPTVNCDNATDIMAMRH